MSQVVLLTLSVPELRLLVREVDDGLINVDDFPAQVQVLDELASSILPLHLRAVHIGPWLQIVPFLVALLQFLLQVPADDRSGQLESLLLQQHCLDHLARVDWLVLRQQVLDELATSLIQLLELLSLVRLHLHHSRLLTLQQLPDLVALEMETLHEGLDRHSFNIVQALDLDC